MTAPRKGTITAVENACQVLREAAALGTFGITEMAKATGMKTSSADRMIKTLAAQGFLEPEGDTWRLGKEAAHIWAAYRAGRQRAIDRARRDLAETEQV